MSETRALTAALSGPAFHGAGTRSALHTSERHVERYAPEGDGSRRGGGMRSLAFADHVAGPWMTAASTSRATQMFSSYANGATNERTVPVSWLFPRPWFQDELDWMAAAREGLEMTPRGSLSTRGTYLQPTSARSSLDTPRGEAWSSVAMPVLSPDVAATVAPSMRPSAFGMGEQPMQRNLRAWSPTVDFAAAAAAEVVMGAMSSVAAAGLPAIAERSPIWNGLAVVTPTSLASEPPAATTFARPSAPSTTSTPSAGTSAMAQVASVVAPTLASPTAMSNARESIARIEHRIEELRTPAPAAIASTDAPASEAAPAPTAAPAPLSNSEQQLATAARSSSAVAQALRTVELLLGAAAPRRDSALATSAPATSAAAVSSTAPSIATGADGGAALAPAFAAPSMASQFAPMAGPRVAMPAGLGGLVTSLETSRTVARPLTRVVDDAPLGFAAQPGFAAGGAPSSAAPTAESVSPLAARASAFAPVWAQSPTALASVASHGARAVDHLSWSDRWLARFAGASPLALSAFDATRATAEPTLRPLSVGSPEIVYIQPQLTARAVESGWDAGVRQQPSFADARPAARAAAAAPTAALRIDDGDRVSDDIFAAIAAAAVAPPRAPRPAAEAPRAADRAATVARSAEPGAPAAAPAPTAMAPVDLLRASGRTSVADLVSIAVPAAPDAGVSAGLASSPMAPALSSLLPLPNAPVFDPRALQAAGLSDAYLGGFLARAALPVGVIASAPTPSVLMAASAPTLGAQSAAMEAWTRRDLALAPTAMRLASSAPDREFIAGGGDVDVTMRGGRGAAALFGAPPSTPAAQAAAVQAAERATVAATAARTAPSAAPIATAPAVPAELVSELVAGSAGSGGALAEAATTRAALETELVALRSALLAGPEVASIPLAHAEHAPLLASAAAVPSAQQAQLPSLGGVVQGASSPMATSLARAAMASYAPADAAAAPAAMAPAAMQAPTAMAPTAMHAPTIAAAGGRPGGLAEAALAWSISEERAASSLAFDFVTPELVLAAKVYGLPPGAAAEAMRLAAAGPSAMSSLATSLDLTFLRAFQATPAAGQRGLDGAAFSATSIPAAPAAIARAAAPGASPAGAAPSAAAPSAAAAAAQLAAAEAFAASSPAAAAAAPGASPAGAAPSAAAQLAAAEALAASSAVASSAGVSPAAAAAPAGAASPAAAPFVPDFTLPGFAPAAASGRVPRGAFLWPAGAVAALGLRALSADGHAGLPVVALELLAAQAVAELGTWVTAFPSAAGAAGDDDGFATPTARGFAPTAGSPAQVAAAQAAGAVSADGAPALDAAGRPLPSLAAQLAQGGTTPMPAEAMAGAPSTRLADMPAEADEAARPYTADLDGGVGPARARFQQIYLALAQSAEGQSLSPSSRAARVMSLLARSDDSQRLTTRERAQAAWSMLPGVYAGGLDVVAPAGGRSFDPSLLLDKRPGLSSLAARAGDAIGSFVNPTSDAVYDLAFPGDSRAPQGAAARAAAPVYVENRVETVAAPASISSPRAGRTYSQFGGGEAEIPAWFEDAARRMFDSQSGGKSDAAMSLAQMVLVTAMPAQQIAAASKGASSGGAGSAPGGAGGGKAGGGVEKPDVDSLALEVFHEVMKLIEIARERSGDPYQ